MSHPRIKPLFSTLQKIWRPLSIISVALTILIALYLFQQANISSLNNEIEAYKVKVNNAGYVDDKLRLQKDILAIEKDATTIQNGAYVSLVQLLGGIVLGITAWVGYQNFRIGEKNLRVTEDKQVNERFSKSIEHLGNEKIDIRLGGIYALEQIAIDSPKYHWTIVEILSAYIRKEASLTHLVSYDEDDSDYGFDPIRVRDEPSGNVTADVRAALTVLIRRKIEQDPQEKKVDLRRVELPLVEIPKANLSKANLSGADLSNADLNGAYLSGANLSGAYLSGANLSGTDLHEANLSRTDLRIAHLSRADLSRANLSHADLFGAKLSGANLSGANLGKVNLSSASLSGTNLSGAVLVGADLHVAALPGANLSESNLNSASLKKASLGGANLSEANLSLADLSGAGLVRAWLVRADLTGADLSGAILGAANLSDANLSDANLSRANLRDANLSNTNLSRANLSGADLSTSKNLSRGQLGSAITDANTRLPEDLKPDNTPSIEPPSNVED